MARHLTSAEREKIAPGILTIDLGALVSNYRQLQSRVAPAALGAVVKADAYGLGAARIVPALASAGCADFFVANLEEAIVLRGDIPAPVRLYVLGGLQRGAEPLCADLDIIPVLNSLDQITRWAALAREAGRKLPAVLQVDTGMSRLGLPGDEAARLLADPGQLVRLDLRFVMSHLASADEPANGQNTQQLAAMAAIARAFPGVPLCFANSGGAFLGTEFHGALARPGFALYGGAPIGGVANPMAPVISLSIRVIQTRNVPAGTLVGYGGSYVAPAAMRLATIAAGYADGLPRHLSNKGAAWFGDTRLPIVGRVSMDSIILDASALPPDALAPGTLVELIGPHQTLEHIATESGTISYEILTRLGRRYHRNYL